MSRRIEKSWLGNLPLNGKLSALLGSLLALFLFSGVATNIVLQEEQESRAEFRSTVELLRGLDFATRAIYQRQSELRLLMLAPGAPDTRRMDAANAAVEEHLQAVARVVGKDAELSGRLDAALASNQSWRDSVAVPIVAELHRIAKAPAEAAIPLRQQLSLRTVNAPASTANLVKIMDSISATALARLDEREQAIEESEALRKLVLRGTMLLAFLCGLLALRLSNVLITRPLRHISGLMERLARHDLAIETPAQLSRRDEIGTLARALAEFKKMAIETADQRWVDRCAGIVSDRIQRATTHNEFARALLEQLCPELDAGVAVLFIRQEAGDIFQLAGHYGFQSDSDGPPLTFRPGEGLVGQCAAQDQLIELSDVPASYLRIRSGLGQMLPPHLALVPVSARAGVLAVLELGLLRPLDARRRRLLDALLPLVTLSLENMMRTLRTDELLARTRMQASELQASEEELRTQQEELQASNEELRQQSDMLGQQKSLLEALQRDTEHKAEALARASQYKTDFLANMSHELRTPLNSLLILSHDLAENRQGNLSEEQVESARIMNDSGTSLLRLINDILDLSKIEAGKMELVVAPVELRGLATRLRRQFDPVARSKGLAFTVEIGDTLPASIEGDAGKLEQVAINLLGNAFKFTQQGSVRLVLRRPAADLPGFPAARTVAIEIHDTGIGIPAEKSSRLFSAFEQVDASTSRQFGGTGLGLAISRRLAQLHHGDIRLHSEAGRGSVFTVLLPDGQPDSPRAQTEAAVPAATPVSPAAPGATDAQAQATILVIEDDPVFTRVLADLIQRKGCRALTAATGQAGLQQARQIRPAGILLDLTLPDTDGWTVLRQIKADPALRDIPVHIVSAADEPANSQAAGITGYLTKPVSADALNNAIDSLRQAGSGPRRVLVIDDDAASRAAVRTLLAAQPIAIEEAETAEQGLAKAHGQHFDCIVLDLGLPGMSGFEFLERLAALEPRPPVVVYSARELSREDQLRIRPYTDSIIVKGAQSSERLLDDVSLFLHSVRGRSPAIAAIAGNDLEGRKVLVVDDDMRNLFALSKVLRNHGMQVLLAQDGSKALRQLEEHPDVELVLMDVMMPVMDGYQTTQAIRQNPRHANLPIISLTAKAMPGDREQSLSAGASDYLTKPVDIPKLLSMMRVWLHR
ncbi:Signal transduction histidine-protein kinase BarA [Pigmentiphaga humi]|uniref:Virulence sensor protein BvgS n=1 Tax=Pigmentiphaga humi TaxID=2478468 RepID=A0A3P4B7V5_9BURK|nr:response regulator [Pigmentiphaga humi]VCU72122.1 Signal transduction histidine-protein kinase BarA [Pigmentiphaga humi]